MTKFYKQKAARLTAWRMSGSGRIHKVRACWIVTIFIAQGTLEDQDFLPKIMRMLGEVRTWLISNNGCRARGLVANPIKHFSLNTWLRAYDPGQFMVIEYDALCEIGMEIHGIIRLFTCVN
jgi:hypothetical protein